MMLPSSPSISTLLTFSILALLPLRALGQDVDQSYPLRNSTWPVNQIPVCWEPRAGSQYTTEKSWVQNAVSTTWGGQNVIDLIGWNTCAPGERGIRIGISDTTLAPHTVGLGTQIDGVVNGMVLNFGFTAWGQSCQNRLEFCIRAIAVHEFGHALGFAHEQNRPDRPTECKDEPQGENGDYMIGSFDMASVMNYCNPQWNGNGQLSPTDIEGLIVMYKRDLPLRRYHPGCDSITKSRSSDCMAAIHRYCFYTKKGPVGYPQEVGPDAFGLMCAEANFYSDVAFSDIPGCDNGGSQTPNCFSSVHRYCDRIGKGGVGIVQELGNGVAGVACVPTSTYQDVSIATLQQYHSGCNSPSRAQESDCLAAVHRYCSQGGLGMGGVIAELGSDKVAVGCIPAGVYTSVKV